MDSVNVNELVRLDERERLSALRAEANKSIVTTPIERTDKKTGQTIIKQYAPVNERVKAFRAIYPEGKIVTEMVKDTGDSVTFRAEVYNNRDELLSVGWAKEEKNSSYINKTSYVENCETSSVGRALGFLGIGIDDAIASTDEVSAAESKREKERIDELGSQKIGVIRGEALAIHIAENGLKLDKVLKYYGVDDISELTEAQHRQIFDDIEKRRKKGAKA